MLSAHLVKKVGSNWNELKMNSVIASMAIQNLLFYFLYLGRTCEHVQLVGQQFPLFICYVDTKGGNWG